MSKWAPRVVHQIKKVPHRLRFGKCLLGDHRIELLGLQLLRCQHCMHINRNNLDHRLSQPTASEPRDKMS